MEKYLISKAKDIVDIHASKSWIITAKSLYPNDFSVQFSAYQNEKSTSNYLEAANCFSYIVMNFQNQQAELWNEISKLTDALRVPEESGGTSEQEFYIKMFQHISYDVQHKILLLTANNSDNNLDHCRLILLLLKRFPQAISTHAPRLLETLVQGMKTPTSSNQFREILVLEALPLIFHKPPELESHLVNRIMAIAFEYYITQMLKESDDISVTNDSWKNIFEILELCGKILKWEQFLPFNKNWNKDVYWQKLIQIVSSTPPRPSENKQILFCATILFVFSLQDYIKNVKQKNGDTEIDFILVEGFRDRETQSDSKRRKIDPILETPKISVNSGCHSDTPGCLVTAAHCWQLLHSNEILQIDFSQLLLNLPVSIWINRFLFDLAVYLGHGDEISVLLKGPTAANMGVYEKNLRLLSLAQNQGTINSQTFDIILSCLSDLPKQTGCFVDNLIIQTKGRHLTLLPLTKKSILQYCTKMIISLLKPKILDPSCSNTTLGNILVLLQLDWPNEVPLAENIFEIIRDRRSFNYLLFPTYILNMDFIEEFMNMWYPHGGEINLEFMPPQSSIGQTRRIGTRGADKNTKEDFKQIIKQQITKSNDDIDLIIIQFIQQERNMIIQTAFDK